MAGAAKPGVTAWREDLLRIPQPRRSVSVGELFRCACPDGLDVLCVRLLQERGRAAAPCGFTAAGGAHVLWPEEALLLLCSGALVIEGSSSAPAAEAGHPGVAGAAAAAGSAPSPAGADTAVPSASRKRPRADDTARAEATGEHGVSVAAEANPRDQKTPAAGRPAGPPAAYRAAFEALLGSCGLDRWVVYAHLRRAGFIVRRATPAPESPGALEAPRRVPPSEGSPETDAAASPRRTHPWYFVHVTGPVPFSRKHPPLPSSAVVVLRPRDPPLQPAEARRVAARALADHPSAPHAAPLAVRIATVDHTSVAWMTALLHDEGAAGAGGDAGPGGAGDTGSATMDLPVPPRPEL